MPKGLEIRFPQNLTSDFKIMRLKFGRTFAKVKTIMKTHHHALEYIKDILRYSYGNTLKPQLDLCQDIGSVLELISDNCSLNDIQMLEFFVTDLNMSEAKDVVQEYNDAVEKFSKTELSKCLNEKFSYCSQLNCQKIIIVVDHDTKEVTMKDVMKLSRDTFQNDYSQHVQLNVIKESRSFTIICSFPLILTENLIATALENIQLLKEKRIKKLIIGYCTVYEV